MDSTKNQRDVMKQIYMNMVMFFICFCLYTSNLYGSLKNYMVKEVTAQELKKILEQNDVLLIDVRQPAEHRSEHIQGDHLIPLSEVSLEKLPKTSQPIVTYCHSGRRSVEAGNSLLEQNPNLDISSLKGGILAWKAARYPIEKSKLQLLPLDRQTQIAAGSIIVTGITLGTFVHAGFFAIPAFVGAGLIYAGVTGWCTMTKILANMPWNQ